MRMCVHLCKGLLSIIRIAVQIRHGYALLMLFIYQTIIDLQDGVILVMNSHKMSRIQKTMDESSVYGTSSLSVTVQTNNDFQTLWNGCEDDHIIR